MKKTKYKAFSFLFSRIIDHYKEVKAQRIAKELGCYPSHITNYKAGTSLPNPDQMELIIDILFKCNVPEEEIMRLNEIYLRTNSGNNIFESVMNTKITKSTSTNMDMQIKSSDELKIIHKFRELNFNDQIKYTDKIVEFINDLVKSSHTQRKQSYNIMEEQEEHEKYKATKLDSNVQ